MLFRAMDASNNGVVTRADFAKRFRFKPPSWEWEGAALRHMGECFGVQGGQGAPSAAAEAHERLILLATALRLMPLTTVRPPREVYSYLVLASLVRARDPFRRVL